MSGWVPWRSVRQLFNWRFVAAIAALVALALVANAVLADDESIEAVIEPEPVEREIDVIVPVFAADASDDFGITPAGVSTGFVDVILDAERTVRIVPGTYGEVSCDELDEINQCALFADVLGDAVVWFALLPQEPGGTVELPPIVDLDDADAVFENGWRIPYPPVIERECDGEDIPSFSDFLRRFGPDSVSVVDLEVGKVVAVRCGEPS